MARRRRFGGVPKDSGSGRLLSLAQAAGIRKGLFKGSRGWTLVAIGAWGLRMFIRAMERNEEIVFSEELRPGQRLIIANDRVTIDAGGESPPGPTP